MSFFVRNEKRARDSVYFDYFMSLSFFVANIEMKISNKAYDFVVPT